MRGGGQSGSPPSSAPREGPQAAAYPVGHVHVGPGVEQVLHDLRVPLLGRDHQGGVPVLVRQIHVGAPLQDLLHRLRVAPFHRHDERGHRVLNTEGRPRGQRVPEDTVGAAIQLMLASRCL